MRWNSFNLVGESINRTKKRLFPFQFKEWFKLGIISAIAGMSFGSGFNFSNQVNSSKDLGDSFFSSIRDYITNHGFIFGIIFSLFILISLFFSYIQSVFTFIFVESLVEKKARFAFSKNNSKGVSLFYFKVILGLISLGIFAIVFSPYIYNFIIGNPVLSSVSKTYFIIALSITFVYSVLIYFLSLILYDFTVPYVFTKGEPVWQSFKKIWKIISKNKKESLVYWLSRIVLGIATGLCVLIIFIVLFFLLILILGLIISLMYYLYGLTGLLWLWVIVGIIFGLGFVLMFVLLLLVLILPFGTFIRYFSLINFEKLTGIKIFKS